jgi:hypothetical protein
MKRFLLFLIALTLFIPSTYAFIDYDEESIANPFDENTGFTLENAQYFTFVEHYGDDVFSLEGQTFFDLSSLRKLKRNGALMLKDMTDKVTFDFPVLVTFDKSHPNMYYCNWYRKDNNYRLTHCTVNVRENLVARRDKVLVHELQHIMTFAKYGKTIEEPNKDHEERREEQIPLVNDIMRNIEIKLKMGVGSDRIHHYFSTIISIRRNIFGEEDIKAKHWEMAYVIMKDYIDQFPVIPN